MTVTLHSGFGKGWVPFHVIAWRAIWIIPTYLVRYAFVALIFCGWGPIRAKQALEQTR